MSPSVVESLPTAEPVSFSGTVEPLKVISLGVELLGGTFGSLEDDPPPPQPLRETNKTSGTIAWILVNTAALPELACKNFIKSE